MIRTAIVILALQPAAAVAPDAAALTRGREITRLVHAGDAAVLGPQLSPEFLAAVGGQDGLAQFLKKVETDAGRELAVLGEYSFLEAGTVSYYRVSRYEKLASATARWVWKPGGAIEGGSIQPTAQPAATDKLGYRTQANLRLPFGRAAAGGAWQVAWGGRDAIHNYHVKDAGQRFAYDLVVARGGAIWRGEGKANADHFCWGEPLLAPAAGRVLVAAGSYPDNPGPGALAPNVPPAGNHVVIDHGRGERSLIGHLQAGSLAVRAGQQVAAGQKLGTCGNSGRSSLPHLHYHLQTGAAYNQGVGLPAQFIGYVSGGRRVPRGEPVRGELINPR